MDTKDLHGSNVLEVAQSISDFGFMAVATAFFLVIAAVMFVLFIRWFLKMLEKNMNVQQDTMRDLLEINRGNSHALHDIRENIGSKSLIQIKTLIEYSIDSGKLKSYRGLINTHRENNLKDNEGAIRRKLSMVVSNIYNERFSKMDVFHYDGKKLSFYFKKEWTETLIDLLMDELYRKDGFDYFHAYNSIDIFYEDLKLKFIKSLDLLEE